MLPVFDFWNLIRLVAKAVFVTLKSPIAIFTALCVGVFSVLVALRDLLGFDQFITNGLAAGLNSLPHNDLGDLILYTLNVSSFIQVFDTTWTFLTRVVPGFLALFGLASTAAIGYRAALALRQTARDILG